MDITIKKSIRNGLYVWIVISIISLGFGIYDLATGFEELNGINIFYTLIGVIIAGVFPFITAFVISLVIYYFKEKKKKR